MIRFDLQTTAVMIMATASSLSAAFWLNHADQRGRAEAAEAPAAVSVPHFAGKSAPARIARSADGHYWAEARIDGRGVRVLVDTGASVMSLTRDDAAYLGLKLAPADFDRPVQTAAGPARAAAVTLASVSVAGARVEQVQALVFEQGLGQSLLGMSYLGRLSGFEATPAALTLRP